MSKRHFLLAAFLLGLLLVIILRDRIGFGSSRAPAEPRPRTAVPATPATPATATAPQATVAPNRADLPGQPAMSAPSPTALSIDERPPLADALGAKQTRPEAEPKIVHEILNSYLRYFGGYPAGESNQQIMYALLGANREKLPFIPSDHPRINQQGELIDAWGTPFFFHQNSRTSMEVRSAGPDRLLYTDDDLVVGRPSRPIHPEPPPTTPED